MTGHRRTEHGERRELRRGRVENVWRMLEREAGEEEEKEERRR